jgi:sarcosine oxidase subunit alpha
MIADWLEEWHQSAWPELRVILTPVTTNFGTLLISGPHARSILTQLPFNFALHGASFPHMTVREGLLGKVPVRVLRTSFSGEVSFEIYMPWLECTAAWSQIASAGAAYGLRAFGTDAMLMLRLEKGYIHVGLDTDSTTIPDDIDMGRLHLKKTGPFVGKQALARPLASKPDRLQLVGFEPVQESERLHEGAQVIRRTGPGREGSITSSCVSPTLGGSIALGMLAGGRARHGEIVEVYHDGTRIEARVRAPCFFDPTGERLRNAS